MEIIHLAILGSVVVAIPGIYMIFLNHYDDKWKKELQSSRSVGNE
jgi:hypothetical protein